jgi:hypothetical protein
VLVFFKAMTEGSQREPQVRRGGGREGGREGGVDGALAFFKAMTNARNVNRR